MERRHFLTKLGIGSVAAAVSARDVAGGAASPAQNEHAHSSAPPASGERATATVTFGAWESNGLDRYPNSSPGASNYSQITPFTATVQAGGTVNFVISGLHQVVVYKPGTKPEDINSALTRPTTGTPAGVPLINDDRNRRVYAGLDPSLLPRDRVEAVHFSNPGVYLVICGVQPHFLEGMYSYVRVVGN